MKDRHDSREAPCHTLPPRGQDGLGRRVLKMTLLWLLFGALVGAVSQPPEMGLVGVVAGMIAGMTVLPVVGVCLGLVGGRVRPAAAGAVAGLAVGALGGLWLGDGNVLRLAQIGLVCGALVGGSASALVAWSQFLLRLANPPARPAPSERDRGV
jgi:hypothetical protein